MFRFRHEIMKYGQKLTPFILQMPGLATCTIVTMCPKHMLD